MRHSTVRLYGTKFEAITERQCVQHIIDELLDKNGGWVVTHNLDHLRRLRSDPAFASICEAATMRVADGMPLIWASRMQGGRELPERIAGSSLIYTLTAAAAEAGCSVYFLGGNEGTADAAARKLQHLNKGLTIAGTECPGLGCEKDPRYVEGLIARLKACSPAIVYVALGSPKQEQLIAQLVDAFPSVWFLGVGVSFSFVAGEIKRAPRWMQQSSLEWLHRLIQEPFRLGKRYIVDGFRTAFLLFAGCLVARAAGAMRFQAAPRKSLDSVEPAVYSAQNETVA
jgi:N-acetylglucosaminyldiphosphoundecaprenol N-acetyl-beta-D-mannosaminyltransferase